MIYRGKNMMNYSRIWSYGSKMELDSYFSSFYIFYKLFFTSSPELPFDFPYNGCVKEVVGMWYGCCNRVARCGLSV